MPAGATKIRHLRPLLELAAALLLIDALPGICQEPVLSFVDSQPLGRMELHITRERAAGRTAPVLLKAQIKTSDMSQTSISTALSPPRIIVDILGPKLNLHRKLAPQKNAALSAVRIGTSENVLRIVFDCAGAALPPFASSQKTGELLLSITESIVRALPDNSPPPSAQAPLPARPAAVTILGAARKSAASPPEAPEMAVGAAEHDTPETVRPAGPFSVPGNAPALPAVSAAASTPAHFSKNAGVGADNPATAAMIPQSPAVQEEIPRLIKIDFGVQGGDASSACRLELNQKADFILTKTEERAYRLAIPKGVLAFENLKLPRFPPQEIPAITYVSAEQAEDAVLITIGVIENSRISAANKDNYILIRAVEPPTTGIHPSPVKSP